MSLISRLILLAAPACLAACGQTLNDSISPGPVPLSIYAEPGEIPAMPRSESPSLTAGHDRIGWRPQTVDVYVNRIEGQPIAELSPQCLQNTPRQRGEYPTVADAVKVTPVSWDQVEDWAIEGVAGMGAILVSPVPIVASFSEFNVERSPHWYYERIPELHNANLARWYTPADGQR